MMKKASAVSVLLLLLLPVQAYASTIPSATIGVDNTFAIEPMVFLNTGTPEAAVFNYFFTLEVFAGMVALFIRICLRVLRL